MPYAGINLGMGLNEKFLIESQHFPESKRRHRKDGQFRKLKNHRIVELEFKDQFLDYFISVS